LTVSVSVFVHCITVLIAQLPDISQFCGISSMIMLEITHKNYL